MNRTSATKLFGEIEAPKPLQAHADKVTISGWCLGDSPEPPAIRLATSAGNIDAAIRHPRPDITRQYPDKPAASLACGFTISGTLPAGVYLARFEARGSDGAWSAFRIYTLTVFPAALAAAIEHPATELILTDRVHLSGWIWHSQHEIKSLVARYGHQEIPCDLGDTRADVISDRAYQTSPARAFRTHTILGAGHGPIRLKARLADNTIALATTPLSVRIDRDENHDGRINLDTAPARLPRSAPREAASPEIAAQAHNILYILHGSFAANSALHVAGLANELSSMGHNCRVAITHDPATLTQLSSPRFTAVLHEDIVHGVSFDDGRGPDIIHAWTTRECVRLLSEKLRAGGEARLIVHLEDNERAILETALGRSLGEILQLTETELDKLISPTLTHPRLGPAFLSHADGVTLITERLADFAPAGIPQLVFSPAADSRFFYPRSKPKEFRQLWDRRPGETVLFYHGNSHAANAAEMRELYLAVVLLNETGIPVTLIRTGIDTVDFLGDLAAACAPHVVPLGLIGGQHHLPDLMALADMFVQPGAPDAFNDYRFPSKLPEFFSIGRPVILPRTNLGLLLRHGIDAYILERADAAGIARAVSELRNDSALAERLSLGAAEYSRKHFSWRRSAEALANFYTSLTS
jgi:glycosyltransferase involved in cell wall biosynthesis